MEREILFRGKRADNGEWIYGYYCPKPYSCFPCEDSIFPIEKINKCWESFRTIPLTLGQFTGLTDKNGRMIFEGDILQRNNDPKDIVQVVFGKFPVIDMETESEVDEVTGWYCDVIPSDALSRTSPFCLPTPLTEYYINHCDMEVIGNVHDHPELLKGEENE